MAKMIQATDDGEFYLPRDVVGDVEPHSRYVVEREGDTFVIRPMTEAERYWAETTPEQRAKDFLDWMDEPTPPVPDLPDEAFSRESIYD